MRRLAPKGRHVGVEPTPKKHAHLVRKFPGTLVLPYAAGDRNADVEFHIDDRASGYNSLGRARDGARTVTVPMRRLDGALPEDFELGFVKVDVEGAELIALRGMERLIARTRPSILFECAVARPLEGGGVEGDDLFAYLTEELGYDVYGPIDLMHGRPPFTLQEFRRRRTFPASGWNNVAVPRERSAPLA